jgi:heptosyltransferase-1
MDKRSARERLASAAYHHKIPVPRDLHAVERTRLLFARALNYQLPAVKGDYSLRDNLPPGAKDLPPSLLFFHGTARAEKLWPESHWVQLGLLATARGYTPWLPWGNAAEKERAQRIAAEVPAARVLPKLDLLGLAGMLLEVAGAVAVDTGLAHLAAALDVPTISLYGPTDTRLIGAYGRNQVHIQSPVGVADTSDPMEMMASINPQRVWDELQALLPEAR